MEITNKRHKYNTIYHWKHYGVIYHDFDELYEIYIKTMNCNHCGKEFPNTKDRCLDHDHETGAFRAIVCRCCNNIDSYIKYPNGITQEDKRHKKKIYYINNKDKINENRQQKYTCGCSGKYSKGHKSEHQKTLKHMDWFMEQID